VTESIVLIVDDLMFAPKLEGALNQLGYQPLFATNETDLTDALRRAPVLVIVDLFSRGFDWEALLRLIKGEGKKARHIPILGFGPHVDLDLREKALLAGCDTVVGRGAIANQLSQLIKKHKWVVDRNRCRETPPSLLQEGIELFNRGQYFECHEVIEDAWNNEPEPVRTMYQGILQIGVACYHIQKKNWRGAMKVLERGIPKIRRFAPTCMGINLDTLLADVDTIRRELVHLGPDGLDDFDVKLFPTIELSK
jgi:predicted metal-dependent hydrolase